MAKSAARYSVYYLSAPELQIPEMEDEDSSDLIEQIRRCGSLAPVEVIGDTYVSFPPSFHKWKARSSYCQAARGVGGIRWAQEEERRQRIEAERQQAAAEAAAIERRKREEEADRKRGRSYLRRGFRRRAEEQARASARADAAGAAHDVEEEQRQSAGRGYSVVGGEAVWRAQARQWVLKYPRERRIAAIDAGRDRTASVAKELWNELYDELFLTGEL